MPKQPDMTHVTRMRAIFDDHPFDKVLSASLQNTYNEVIHDFDEIFKDSQKTELLEDDDLLVVLRKIYLDQVIAPYARNTTDKTVTIAPLLQNAIFHIIDGKYQRKCTKKNMTDLLTAQKQAEFIIKMSTHTINYDYSLGPLDITNWGNFTEYPTGSPPTSAPSATDIATAVAQAIRSVPAPTPTIPAVAIATAVTQAMATMNLPQPSGTSGGTAPSARNPQLYNYTPSSSLPVEVRDRYKMHLQGELLPGSTLAQPYTTGNYYFDEGDKIFLINGALWFSTEIPDEKKMMKLNCFCLDETMSAIRTWYIDFTRNLFTYNYYCHPIWNFRSNHGGLRGFTIGPGHDCDLPARCQVPIDKMATQIHNYLTQPKVFPQDGFLRDVVASADGDGYVALCSILRLCHPAWHETPALFIKNYPSQGDLSIQEYHNVFKDFIALRAYTRDIVKDLTDPGEVDIFINNAKHGTYLARVTRDERRQALYADRYKGHQLLVTLAQKLTASDSPALKNRPQQGATPKSAIKIQRIATSYVTDTDDDGSAHYDSDYTLDPDTDEERIALELNAITAPSDKEREFETYKSAVLAIKNQPNLAYRTECIVCGEEHTFDQCPRLKDLDFLQGHYIRFCQQIRRDRAALNKKNNRSILPSKPTLKGGKRLGKPKPRNQVNFVDWADYTDDEETQQDFLLGRV